MRKTFCQSLIDAPRRSEFAFLTASPVHPALQPLQASFAERFVVVEEGEQHVVSISAGLASAGLRPWVYGNAPHVYARAFEQIRNDVCIPRLPVVLVGDGGGYEHGVLGPTEHALEDYGTLLSLPALHAYVPAFAPDLRTVVGRLSAVTHPAYLRVGVAEDPAGIPAPTYAPWRRLVVGRGWVVLVVGPLVSGIWEAVRSLDDQVRPTLWLLSELPFGSFPVEFLDDLARSRRLLVLEEHVARSGVASLVARALVEYGHAPARFAARSARGYPSGRYGSQKFHRRECGLDPASIVQFLIAEAE
ncbi:MAG: hypothetical protein P4L84_25230 [Isosphaeraceae bacterium]|nr:hypothetical protein [Isosphaeraceae bacterium]